MVQATELTDDRLILAALGSLPGIGSVTISEALKRYGTPIELWQTVQKIKRLTILCRLKSNINQR